MKKIIQGKPPLLVIVGPTASGKSNLAVRLAEKLNGEIISADSRQVYRGLDVGTNKITKREMRSIPHHLLDVANPNKQFSAANFKKLAEKSIDKITKKEKLPIIVGGTGFYIDVLVNNIQLPDVSPNRALRNELERYNAEELFKMLQKSNPVKAQIIDRHNKVRLIRALEVASALGNAPPVRSVDTECLQWVYVGLKLDWLDLERRIHTRLLKQLPNIIKESRKLYAEGLSYKRMFELGLEYRYVCMYLQGKLTQEEITEKLYIEIRRYAKRQMTWFKRNKKIRWFTLSAVERLRQGEYKEIEKYVTKILIKK